MDYLQRSWATLTRTRFRAAVVSGLISVGIALPVSKVAYDTYISMTVSVIASQEMFSEMYRGAMYLVGFASFFSGFFSSYFTARDGAAGE